MPTLVFVKITNPQTGQRSNDSDGGEGASLLPHAL